MCRTQVPRRSLPPCRCRRRRRPRCLRSAGREGHGDRRYGCSGDRRRLAPLPSRSHRCEPPPPQSRRSSRRAGRRCCAAVRRHHVRCGTRRRPVQRARGAASPCRRPLADPARRCRRTRRAAAADPARLGAACETGRLTRLQRLHTHEGRVGRCRGGHRWCACALGFRADLPADGGWEPYGPDTLVVVPGAATDGMALARWRRA